MNLTCKLTFDVMYRRRPTPRLLRWRRGEQQRPHQPGMPPRVGLPGTAHMALGLGVGFLRGRRASYTAGLPLLWVRRSPCHLLGRGIKVAPKQDAAAHLPRTGRWWRKTPPLRNQNAGHAVAGFKALVVGHFKGLFLVRQELNKNPGACSPTAVCRGCG